MPIDGLDRAAATPGAAVFHAATVEQDGRLLTVAGEGATFAEAIATASDAVGAQATVRSDQP